MNVFSNKNALDANEILRFSSYYRLNITLTTLADFAENPSEANSNTILFTGTKPDKYNTPKSFKALELMHDAEISEHSITHHWLAVYNNYVFDSYGYYVLYDSLKEYDHIITQPHRLQEFDSAVCGEYSLAFLSFINNYQFESDTTPGKIGRDFCIEFGLSNDRAENDNIILDWYDEASAPYKNKQRST